MLIRGEGCWILSFDWIETCAHVKQRVEEEGFEVAGCSTAPASYAPRRARLSREAGSLGLFNGLNMCFPGNFVFPMPSKDELISLARAGGASVFNRDISNPTSLARLAKECLTTELSAPADGPLYGANLLIIYDPKSKQQTSKSNAISGAPPRCDVDIHEGRLTSEVEELAIGARKILADQGSESSVTNSCSDASRIVLLPASWLIDCIAHYRILPAGQHNIPT
ncbi:unnamed protein product [Protopolystoma xenopodis]|uniref:BRCT domain-containing protein n=1 Tax=Protopolystoma xenopodis TaxID=117903 RepID=A0A3S5C6P3_9PLAT|nr:unnamed protein product [Protopolystoma xenopodis]